MNKLGSGTFFKSATREFFNASTMGADLNGKYTINGISFLRDSDGNATDTMIGMTTKEEVDFPFNVLVNLELVDAQGNKVEKLWERLVRDLGFKSIKALQEKDIDMTEIISDLSFTIVGEIGREVDNEPLYNAKSYKNYVQGMDFSDLDREGWAQFRSGGVKEHPKRLYYYKASRVDNIKVPTPAKTVTPKGKK